MKPSNTVSSSQSIDLTDDLDDIPSNSSQVATPPALVAIQRNNAINSQSRSTVKLPTAVGVRTPEMINRSILGRRKFSLYHHQSMT